MTTKINPRKLSNTFTTATSESIKLNVVQSEDNQGEGCREEETSVSEHHSIALALF